MSDTPDPSQSPGELRAPRGPHLTCRHWLAEAALRMLMNNLDPEVGERPQDLVVYGGIGKAAPRTFIMNGCARGFLQELARGK